MTIKQSYNLMIWESVLLSYLSLYLIFSTSYAFSAQIFANACYFWWQIMGFKAACFCNSLIARLISAFKISQMICGKPANWTFAKNALDFTGFCGHKITHFSQMMQAFHAFSSFSKKIDHAIL